MISNSRHLSSTGRAARRAGFTLLELLLVLLLLILIAAVSWPSFDGWFQSHRLGESADTIRGHWVKARTAAMEEGRPYRFFWQPATGFYRLAPDDFEHWPELAGTAAGPRFSGVGEPARMLVEDELPGGVVFQSSPLADGLALTFAADGTAKIYAPDGSELPQLELVLADRRGQVKVLQMRALTGAATVVNPGVP